MIILRVGFSREMSVIVCYSDLLRKFIKPIMTRIHDTKQLIELSLFTTRLGLNHLFTLGMLATFKKAWFISELLLQSLPA
jgi:hypothetical protein